MAWWVSNSFFRGQHRAERIVAAHDPRTEMIRDDLIKRSPIDGIEISHAGKIIDGLTMRHTRAAVPEQSEDNSKYTQK